MKNTKKGFTLVELLVVIAILAILATVSVVGYTSFINRANDSNAETEAHQIQTTIESYIIAGDGYDLGTSNGKDYYVDEDANGKLRVYEDGTTPALATLTDAQVKAMNEDFAGLPGAIVVTNGVLTYEGKDASKVITIE